VRQLHHVLIVEGDARILRRLRAALANEPVTLTEVTTGSAARTALADQSVDVALVALTLSDVDGLQLVSELRDTAPEMHVIIMSKRTSEADRLRGFAAGADDYITKPFEPTDVVARVKVGLRHRGAVGDDRLELGELTIDLRARQAWIGGAELTLPRLEFDLLAHLARRPAEACSRQDLLETVWGSSTEYQLEATVTEHVGRLRRKFAALGARGISITTLRGTGYRFDLTPADEPEPERLVATAVAPDGVVALAWRHAAPGRRGATPTDLAADRAEATKELAEGVAEIASWPVARDDREFLQAALIGISTEVEDAVVIISPDLTVRSFNRAAEALYGWSEDEVRGRPIADILPWVGTPKALAAATDAVRVRGTWMGEIEQRRRDGTSLRIRCTATALRAADGKSLGVIVVNRPAGAEPPASAPSRLQADEILAALERDEFLPYFQPIVRLDDDAIVGVEALARWEQPDGTLLEPFVFLPEAERSGLIVRLGTTILEKACLEAARWLAGGSIAHLAVNISARQLGDASTTDLVTGMLARHELPRNALWLEVTETSLIEDLDRAATVLGTLTDAGVSFAIDDFGTGWASLTYLRRFPVHGIKIDRSFVAGLGTATSDTAIVRSILKLGRDLSLAVVAEGVETEAQRDNLRSLGCELAQGYLFSRPVPAAEIHRMLADASRTDDSQDTGGAGACP
jgi:PAS domain S-box-containing protein